MTLDRCLKEGVIKLQSNNIGDSEYDALSLLEEVTGVNRSDFFLRKYDEISQRDYSAYMELINIRCKHIPLQHILGVANFYGYEFYVDSNVLIPRQDTEVLIEHVLKLPQGDSVLDMCCGSGCIGITLFLENAKRGINISVTASDISSGALNVTRKNVNKLIGKNDTFHIVESDLFDNIEGRFSIIVCNPPYIPTKDIEELEVEVREHDPYIALDGDTDGLGFYKRIIPVAGDYLEPNGYLCFEIGYNQKEALRELMLENGYKNISVHKDLGGLDRVVIGGMTCSIS